MESRELWNVGTLHFLELLGEQLEEPIFSATTTLVFADVGDASASRAKMAEKGDLGKPRRVFRPAEKER